MEQRNMNVQDNFISKKNMATIYKTLLTENNYTNVSKENKKIILQELAKIMRDTIQKINLVKVNNNNIQYLIIQFNYFCLKDLTTFVKKNINMNDRENEINNRKYNRDFNTMKNIYGESNNTLPRPENTNEGIDINDRIKKMEELRKQSTYQQMPSIHSNKDFQRRDEMSLMDRMAELEKARNNSTSDRPPTPDFLKSEKVGNKENKFSVPSIGNTSTLSGFDSDSNVVHVNFGNSDKLIDDSESLEERLKRMEAERSMDLEQLKSSQTQPELPSQPEQLLNNKPINNNPINNQSIDNNPINNQTIDNNPINNQSIDNNPINNQSIDNNPIDNHQNNIQKLILNQNSEQLNIILDELNSLKSALYNKYKYFQLEINKTKPEYNYKFRPIKNVIGIKLISYSLPESIYNFNDGEIQYVINNNTYSIYLERGYYDNTTILNHLNNNPHLYFSYNHKKKIMVTIKSNHITSDNDIIESVNFNFISSKLLDKLGFEELYSHNGTLTSKKIIDYRLPTKLKLYVNNIDSKIPMGILNFNGTSLCEFNFNSPITLNNLHLIFKSMKGELYNFDDMEYNLSFQLITI
jgi:hypothetical protein